MRREGSSVGCPSLRGYPDGFAANGAGRGKPPRQEPRNMPKLKTLLFLGAAGGVVVAVRKRASSEQVQQVVDKAKEAAPAPVKQAVDAAVQTVTDTVSKVQGDEGDGDRDATRRYAAPAEAGAQNLADCVGHGLHCAEIGRAHV